MNGDKEAFEEIVRGIRSGDPAIKEAVTRELQRLTPRARHQGLRPSLARIGTSSG